MLQDHVVAIVSEDSLWNILPAIHRSQLGHLARVIRASKRGGPLTQLQRAGVPVMQAPPEIDEASPVLLVSAAARSVPTAAMVVGQGAERAWVVTALGAWNPVDDTVIAPTPVPAQPPAAPISVPGRAAPPASHGAPDAATEP